MLLQLAEEYLAQCRIIFDENQCESL